MDASTEATNTSIFEPASDLIQEDDCNTLLLYLPGFTKEQLKVQLTTKRVLKVSGRRPLTNNRWSSFQKDFPVPENCNTNKISAKFEDGILYVMQPKEKTGAETPKPAEVRPPHPPPAAKVDPPPRQPTPIKKIAQPSGDTKPKTSPAKPVESKEEIKSAEKSSAREEEEKSGGGDEKAAAAGNKAAEKSEKAAGSGNKAAEKRDKGRGEGIGAGSVEADYSNLSAASPAARLKDARKKMTNIAVLLCVFALGIYVSRLPWFSKSAGD